MPAPHLHAHIYALNVTYDHVEKRWKAGQFGDIKRDGPYWEASFDAKLSDRLNKLGYATEKDPKYSFELAGYPEPVIDRMSPRRNLIEAKPKEKGIEDSDQKHEIGRRSRQRKVSSLSRTELRKEWDEAISPEERAQIERVKRGEFKPQRVTAEQARDYAKGHMLARESVVSEKRMKAVALQYGVGSVLPNQIDAVFAADKDLIRIERDGEMKLTTEKALDRDIAVVKFAADGVGKCEPLAPHAVAVEELKDDQRTGGRWIVQSRDRVTGLVGPAGTGKTYTLKHVVADIEANGKQVFMFAPSAQASRGVLRGDGFENADTLEGMLVNEAAQRKLRGQVVIVDEAGMIGMEDMSRLFEVVKNQDARLILVGDYKQHGSVKAGDAFRVLESEGGLRYAHLTENRRQKNTAYKDVVNEIEKGSIQKGFDQLDSLGWVIEKQGADRYKALVEDYLKAVADRKKALIVSPTHKEADALTEELRDELRIRGELRGKERGFMVRRAMNWTDAEKQDGRNYRKGLIVEFYQNVEGEKQRVNGQVRSVGSFKRGESAAILGRKEEGSIVLLRQDGTRSTLPMKAAKHFQVYGAEEMRIATGEHLRITQNGRSEPSAVEKPKRINNGDIFTVEGFTENGDIRLSNGQVLPKDYGHLRMGYVDTSYASQGKTVDRVFIAAGSASVLAVNQQQWYVSVSRGKEECRVYVDDKQEMREHIARTGKRLSAVELVKGTRFDRWAQEKQKILERQQAMRYLHDVPPPERVPERGRIHGRG